MIITSSSMQMSSSRAYSNSVEVSSANKTTAVGAGALSYSGNQSATTLTNSRSGTFSFQSTLGAAIGTSSKENPLPSENYLSTGNTDSQSTIQRLSNPRTTSWQHQIRKYLLEYIEMMREQMLKRLCGHAGSSFQTSTNADSGDTLDLTTNNSGNFTVWKKELTTTYTCIETEATSFSATGTVVTADNRSISINVQLNMSRSFTETLSAYSSSTDMILTDPLVIQLEDSPISISDETFMFDIDSDGTADEISKLSAGNAFLAIDLNQDGVINNGSELFGTKSGDGFADLSVYDEDKNGWIDENDSVFQKLLLWQKDDTGKDSLIDLKAGDIGAIYLGAQSTRFSFNSLEDNHTNAVLKSTGVYLHENGSAGTIAQVDFAM